MRSKEVEEKIVFLKELLKLNERMFEEVGSGLFHKNISKAIETVLNYISELEEKSKKCEYYEEVRQLISEIHGNVLKELEGE